MIPVVGDLGCCGPDCGSGRSLGPDRCIPLTFDMEPTVLLWTSILLAVIVTAESDFLLWHATDFTGKQPGELYTHNSKDMFCRCTFLILCVLFE